MTTDETSPPRRLPPTLPSSSMLLMALAVLTAIGGVLMLTEATKGVGLICAACFLSLWARILQAGAHHHDNHRARE